MKLHATAFLLGMTAAGAAAWWLARPLPTDRSPALLPRTARLATVSADEFPIALKGLNQELGKIDPTGSDFPETRRRVDEVTRVWDRSRRIDSALDREMESLIGTVGREELERTRRVWRAESLPLGVTCLAALILTLALVGWMFGREVRLTRALRLAVPRGRFTDLTAAVTEAQRHFAELDREIAGLRKTTYEQARRIRPEPPVPPSPGGTPPKLTVLPSPAPPPPPAETPSSTFDPAGFVFDGLRKRLAEAGTLRTAAAAGVPLFTVTFQTDLLWQKYTRPEAVLDRCVMHLAERLTASGVPPSDIAVEDNQLLVCFRGLDPDVDGTGKQARHLSESILEVYQAGVCFFEGLPIDPPDIDIKFFDTRNAKRRHSAVV